MIPTLDIITWYRREKLSYGSFVVPSYELLLALGAILLHNGAQILYELVWYLSKIREYGDQVFYILKKSFHTMIARFFICYPRIQSFYVLEGLNVWRHVKNS